MHGPAEAESVALDPLHGNIEHSVQSRLIEIQIARSIQSVEGTNMNGGLGGDMKFARSGGQVESTTQQHDFNAALDNSQTTRERNERCVACNSKFL